MPVDVDFLSNSFSSAKAAPVSAPPAEPDLDFLGKAFSGVAPSSSATGLPPLPPISEYYAKHPADESDFWHTPALDILGPEDFPGPAGVPRIPPLGREGTALRGATEFAGGVEESALGSLSGMTSREGIVTYPLFSVPYVGPALALGMGAKAVGSGAGRLVAGIEQGEPRMAGEGVGEAIVGGLMLGGGAHQARGPIGEATPAGRLAAEINRSEFRPRPVSIEGEMPGLTPLRRSAAAFAQEQGIPVEVRQPVEPGTEIFNWPATALGQFEKQKFTEARQPEPTPSGEFGNVVSYFWTKRGSSYAFNGSTSIRRRAPQAGEQASREPQSIKTVFVTPDVWSSIREQHGPGDTFLYADGQLDMAGTKFPASETPSIGLMPIELYEGKQPHFGSEIVEIRKPPQKGAPSAIPIQSAETTDVGKAPGDRPPVVQGIPKPEELTGARPVVAPKEEVPAATEAVPRLSLRNNIATELPEFTLEAINRSLPEPRTGRTFPASVLFDQKQKTVLLIKGPAQRATYKVPLAEIPHEIVKGGINVDKAALLAFLNDKAKRQWKNAAGEFVVMVDERNVTHYAPEDIDAIIKPKGRPATGVGTSLKPVPLSELPKVQKKVGQPVGRRRQMLDITRRAFDELRQRNPQIVEQLLGRRPEELDEAFWTGIRDELLRENEEVKSHKDPMAAADALVADLRRLKEIGDLDWLAAESKDQKFSQRKKLANELSEADYSKTQPIKSPLPDATETPVSEFLDSLSLSDQRSSKYLTLVKWLNDNGHLEDVSVTTLDTLTDKFSGRRVGGLYDGTAKVIYLGKSAFEGESLALRYFAHEAVHAALLRKLRAIEGDDPLAKAYQQSDLAIYERLKSLMETAAKEAAAKGLKHYGLTNIHEFVSEAVTRPSFQRFLEGIKLEGATAWSRFVDLIKSLFGFKGDKTVLSETLKATGDLLESPVPTQGMLGMGSERSSLERLGARYETTIAGEHRVLRGLAALESPEKVEEYISPLEPITTPEKFRSMAAVLNKNMVPPPAAERFNALPEGVRLELGEVFPGRIATYRDRPDAPSFRDVMRNEAIPPYERSDYARHAFDELRQYQSDKRNVFGELDTVSRDLEAAITKAIEIIPETNEAELLATSLIHNVLDRIKAERERTAEGAQANARIEGGIQHIDAFNDLLRQPVPLARAMRGIANLIGRAALTAARPGGDVLELIGQRSGFEGGIFERGTNQWIQALAAHLARLETPEGNRVINASEEIIRSTLHALYQIGDAREALHEFQLADDGTLRRFRADYLEDLRSKIPRGFNTILRQYATAQVEADALKSAQRRLDRRIDTLTTRRANLEQARDFLLEHDRDPAFMDFGKAVVQYTGAVDLQFTRDGTKVIYPHPLTGKLVEINETFKDGGSVENIQKMRDLAQAGLTYAAQPGADPILAAGWIDYAENIDNYLLAASSHYDVLIDPAWNVFKRINNMAPFLIAETQLSRIQGFGAARATRALRAMGTAMKAKNAFQKDAENNLVAANIDAWKSHGDIESLQQWQDEVAAPMHDKRQHFGQNVYRVGDRISGYGHVITAEDMKAVKAQTHYDHVLVALHQRALSSAIAEAPQKVKIGKSVQRFALARGPGTITRLIPQTTRDLPAQWFDAILRRPEERREGETEADAGAAASGERLDRFLGAGRNFFKLVMGHVLEDERDYGQLGKGPLAEDYKALRLDERELARSGRLPNNMSDLSDWLAAHHNAHLRQEPPEPPITAADVRRLLIQEVSNDMRALQEYEKEAPNRAKVDITSYENSFTQPRDVKIVPGTLYEYGMADRIKANRMGNDAVEYYVVRWRDSLQELYDDLLRQKTNISDTLKQVYGSERRKAVKQLTKAIRSGAHEDRLGRYQLTLEEVNRNIDRVGKMLQTSKELLKRRGEFYGDDIANRLFSPTTSFFAGNVLLSPSTWILNGSSGSVMGALKVAEISRGGWLSAPFAVVKAHLRTVYKSILSRPPKNEQERIIQRLAADPVLQEGIIELIGDSNREFQDRQLMRRSGVVDSFSYSDNLGLDRDLPLVRNLRNAVETIRSISAKPEPSLTKTIFSYLGVAPKTYTLLTRSIGMRWADNWINLQSTTLANGIAERLRLRSIKSFDNRLEHDPRFAELYREYGDSFQRFSIALAGEGEGGFLTPSEITGRWGPTTNKAAVQLRRTFFGNNTPVDKLMLRYWWNQRAANGNRNAPFMTQAERSALQFALAEDVNMATLASRSQWFASSRLRQMLGVLGQYWIWNTDRLSDIVAGVRGQKSYGRYIPAAMAFLIGAGLVGLVSGQLSQQVTQQLYGTVSSKPAFWEATDDPQKLKIILSNMANYLGMIGSAAKYFMDTPGKLGYRNPIFLQNIAIDAMDTIYKAISTGDPLNPTLDFFGRYMPPVRLALNRSSMREGLMEVRNAANALRAATPDTLEAKRRQPTSGSDLRSTPMTPLYNAILNAAAVGDWSSADEAFARAVEQARAGGNPNPEQAIISAIRTRSPETSVYTRALTDEERQQVYGRLSPENRATVDRVNATFDAIASRYGTGGGAAGGAALGRGSAGRSALGVSPALADLGGFTGSRNRRLSLGSPRGVRSGFRTRSLRRGLRTRGLLRGGLRSPRIRSRLRRLAV